MSRAPSRDRFLVEEMIRHLAVVADLSQDGKGALQSDPVKRYALEHACELLAEASKHTSREFKTLNPAVAWAPLRELRTAVAHPYDEGSSSVGVDRLWTFVTGDAPALRRQLGRAKFPT